MLVPEVTAARKQNPATLREAKEKYEEIVSNAFAKRTLTGRKNLWSRMVRWAESQQVEPCGETAALFVASLGVRGKTKQNYCSQLNQVGKLLWPRTWRPERLEQLQKMVLRASRGKEKPASKAHPVAREELRAMVRRWRLEGREELAAAVGLAWLTASRVDDILSLRTIDVVQVQGPFVLDFIMAKNMTEERQERFVKCCGEGSETIRSWVQRRVQGQEEEVLVFGITKNQVYSALKEQDSRLSNHSMKRGALQYLLACCANGVLHPKELGWAARHKSKEPIMNETTFLYLLEQREALAEVLSPVALALL